MKHEATDTPHEPTARYCIVITTPPLPRWLLRDDICCPRCCELRAALELDPDHGLPWSPNPCPVHGPGLWEGNAA